MELRLACTSSSFRQSNHGKAKFSELLPIKELEAFFFFLLYQTVICSVAAGMFNMLNSSIKIDTYFTA